MKGFLPVFAVLVVGSFIAGVVDPLTGQLFEEIEDVIKQLNAEFDLDFF